MDGIADVGYFNGCAYLNAWGPNCASVGGPGAGVHVVDVRNPAAPTKVGFLPVQLGRIPAYRRSGPGNAGAAELSPDERRGGGAPGRGQGLAGGTTSLVRSFLRAVGPVKRPRRMDPRTARAAPSSEGVAQRR